ncbi:adenylate/guanylate cyclase domain-containing protein [Stappia sp. F7233]|uniref:Adenylate/guanylate cyclase domain-containing protein n=2 Tax=Stappia albiluteola TaxID=2758565 RepID=A0A839AB41_9HYPH|nr:adenylate/guanylate cyclase domain-containing protein [Stappia albiluteola]
MPQLQKKDGRLKTAFRYIARGGPTADGIPARVRNEIAEREAAAERLIGWVQLGVVVFFATLYSIAPRAEGSGGFNFVPITLAAYFLFTVLRVVLSYRIVLPQWYLIVSIVVDVALLCGLIFSFHIQYQQHPAFYLKAPTLMYVFIFISLRALRFDPRFVLTTGLIAVGGWLVLVAYALVGDMGRMHITRNYIEYLTSNAILIGAELDKTIVILGVTAILSLALYRGRQILFDSIQDHAAAEDLKRFFAPEVATSITGADETVMAGQGETRNAAILLVDLRSFTSTAETLAPEVVMRVLARYQAAVLPVIEQHNGRVDKFLGDGILATFGAVRPSEHYAADAMRAAEAIVAAMDKEAAAFNMLGWPKRLSVGTAVACGGVTVGVVGARDRLEFTVIGNAVNLAAKLEDANKVQATRALTDSDSYERARAQGYERRDCEVRPGAEIAGISHPVDLVVIA